MAITRIAPVALPFSSPRFVPDNTALAALYTRMGVNLSQLDLQKGQIAQQGADRLGQIFGNYVAGRHEEDLNKAAVARATAQHIADQAFQAAQAKQAQDAVLAQHVADAAEREKERQESIAAATQQHAEAGVAADIDKAPRGVVGNALFQAAQRFPNQAARFVMQDGVATLPMTPAEKQAADALAATKAQQELTNKRLQDQFNESKRENLARDARENQKVTDAKDDKVTLTPGGLDMAALNYRKTGVMPPLGMGDKGTRQNIINRAASLTPSDMAQIESTGADIAGAKQDYTANTESLKALQKSRDAIGAFEKTATKNIDVFLETAGKVVDSGSPLANTLLRAASGKLLGSPDQAAYDAARQVATNEIAKITSNPTLAGQLSDSARHEVDAFNPANATLAQSVRVMRLLKNEINNRTTALDTELATVRGRVKTAMPATGPADLIYDPATKTFKKAGG